MKNIFIVCLAMAVAYSLAACKGGRSGSSESAQSVSALHDHADHDHEGHDHESENGDHAHATHDHDATHDEHDHAQENHDHAAEDPHGHEDHAHESAGAKSDEIVFTPEQAAKVEFEVIEVQPSTFSQVVRTGGQIMPAQGDWTVITAPVSGVVSLGAVRLVEGAPVSKGQTLFYISSKNVADGDYIARTEAAYKSAKAEYERAKELVKDKIVSQQAYEQAELAYEQARVAYEAVASSRSDRGTEVDTPLGGYVTSLDVEDGAYVEAGAPLATVSQNRRLTLRAEVSQRYYEALRTIRGANFRTPYDGKVYATTDLGGRVISAGTTAAAGSFYMPVSIEFDNRAGIVPGSFVEVFLLGAPETDVLAVPETALLEELGSLYVFVQLDESCYEKRQVRIGASDGVRVKVLSGLAPGERVVSKGAYNVKLASASGEIPHGHSH